jgi:hypothetical protein
VREQRWQPSEVLYDSPRSELGRRCMDSVPPHRLSSERPQSRNGAEGSVYIAIVSKCLLSPL